MRDREAETEKLGGREREREIFLVTESRIQQHEAAAVLTVREVLLHLITNQHLEPSY